MAVTFVLMIILAAMLQQTAGQLLFNEDDDTEQQGIQRNQQQPEIASVSTDRADQQKVIVDKHNNHRRSVNPPASNMLRMEWNPIAAKNAKSWARQCTFNHSPQDRRTINGIGCGENLYMSTAFTSWDKAIQAWYDEVKDFTYGQRSERLAVVGHYTQMVWYRSYQIGCAVAYCPRRTYNYYYVCHYCPAGNIVGSMNKPYKSGRPCADCPNACDNKLCTNPCKYSNKYSNCPDLKRSHGCNHPDVKDWCEASCQCTTEII